MAQTDLSDSQVQERWQNVTKASSPSKMIQMDVWGQLCPSVCGGQLLAKRIPAWLFQWGFEAPESLAMTLNCTGGYQALRFPQQIYPNSLILMLDMGELGGSEGVASVLWHFTSPHTSPVHSALRSCTILSS